MGIINVETPDGEVVQVEIAGDAPTAEESATIARTFGMGPSPAAEPDAGRPAPTAFGYELPQWMRYPQAALEGFNRGLANIAGAPVDLATLAMNAPAQMLGYEAPIKDPIGGAQSIRSVTDQLGLTDFQAETPTEQLLGRVGEEFGAAALPTGAALGVARRAASPAMGALERALVDPLRQNLGRTLGAETVATAGGGTAAGLAQLGAPDSPLAEFGAQLAGSFAPGAIAAGARKAIDTGRGAVASVTGGPPRQQVGQRLVEAASDPEAAIRALQQRRAIPGDFEPTAAQVTQDPGLMTFERGQRAASPEAAARALQVEAAQNAAIRRQRAQLQPRQTPEATEEFFKGRLDAVKGQIADRVRTAQRLERRAIEGLGPRGGRGAESVAVRDELEGAMRDARAMESDMWAAVDPAGEMRFSTAPLQQSVSRWFEKLPSAYQAFVPRRIMRVVEGLRPEEGIQDLTALRSVISSQARTARRQGNFNEARVLRQLDDKVLGAIDDLPYVSAEYDAARNFSRFLNQTFNDGVVKRMMREGVEPETAAALAYRPGEPGGVGVRQVREALEFQQPGMEAPDAGPGLRALEDYARRDLAGAAITPGGRVSPEGIERYLQRYGPAMQQMPGVAAGARRAAAQARGAERLTGAAQRAERAAARTPQARVVAKGAEPEIKAALASGKPAQRLGQLVRSARKDQTGAALEGLRRGVWDQIMRGVDLGQTDVAKTPLMSPGKFRQNLTANRQAMLDSGLYSKTDLRRIDRLLDLMETMESVGRAKAVRGGPGTGQELASRRQAPTFSLPQALGRMYNVEKGVVSKRFVLMELAARTLHRALGGLSDEAIASLTQDALYDPKLAATLMREVTTPQQRAEAVRALRLHLLNQGYSEEE